MYEAYSDYESMMNMAEEIVVRCAMATHGKLKVAYLVIRLYPDIFSHLISHVFFLFRFLWTCMLYHRKIML